MFDPDDLDSVTAAYHEAGHVLMAHLLGGEVVHSTLEHDDGDFMGQTEVVWRGRDEAARRRCSALVALAGPVAESRWRGQAGLLDALTAWRADWQEVQLALSEAAEPGDQPRLLQRWLGEVTRRLADPAAWELLCRIADALEAHQTLDDDLLAELLG